MTEALAHRAVEAQAVATPDAVAVAWGAGSLGYRAFDEEANRLAHHLVSRGVGPERLVGVSLEPSPELLVTMTAIWKAGGAYVPVDPSLPLEVAQGMLEDAGVALLLHHGPSDRVGAGVETVDLATLDLFGQPVDPPDVALGPGNLAYCVFTSGSTGRPKPVAVEHESFVNHAHSLAEQLGLTARDRVLQSTAIAFDAALEEILPAWVVGAAVVIPDERRFTSHQLTEVIERLSVTMVSLPSAYWHQWVDDLVSGLVTLSPTLRVVFIGGDKILVEKLEAWYAVPGADAVTWVSDYGPTETSISVCLHVPARDGLTGSDDSGYALVPIGRPFAGAEIHLLDADLLPVPDGDPGDLWVGGPPVSRGYHATPATTADRFRPDPFGPPGWRMYHTGDRATRLPNGVLVFLGRSDRQVKVRGHRVELGQVESALHGCGGVRDAVVLDAPDPPFGSFLAAYVEAEPGVTEEALRAELADRLPAVMVPRVIVLLDTIPRSPLNGKVARAALPPPPSTDRSRTSGTPMTTLERVLSTLVGDVLGSAGVDRHDDFFAAGGDSLRALQVLNRVAEVTGVALTFEQLRAAPHVAGLATLVREGHGRGGALDDVVPTARRGERAPASRGQQALWFLDQVHRGAPLYAIPICYRLRGPVDLERLDRALGAVVARHEALRTVLEQDGGTLWQRILPPGEVHSAVTGVRDLKEAAWLAQAAAQEPFDLARGPLLRSQVFRVNDAEHLWLLDVHHAVFDAWSLGVLWRELTVLYAGGSLPPPPTQYADYSAWQERWLDGPEADAQRTHWRSTLAGELPSGRLGTPPTDYARVGSDGFALSLQPGDLDGDAVTHLARECGTTPYVVLLAACFATLRRTTGVPETVVGVPVACRNRPGTEELVGYLVNTVAVRVAMPDGQTFRDLVRSTDAALAVALTHQELPFADAVSGLARDGRVGENPVFQAMFAFQSTPLDGLDGLEGVEVVEHFVHSGTAKTAVTWTTRQDETGLVAEIEYAADLFDRTAAQEWRDTLLGTLDAVLAAPDDPHDEEGPRR